MTGKELRRLGRRELLELLVEQEQQNESLQKRVTELEQLLKDRSVTIENAGTLAEAALALNDVFERADKAAAQYLENIKRNSEQQQSIYDRIVSDAERKATAILVNAEREKQQKMKAADEYWNALSVKLEAFYQSHNELRELLSIQSDVKRVEIDEKSRIG